MKTGIDIDGVLRDTHAGLFSAWLARTGILKTHEDITDWQIHKFMDIEKAGMTQQEFYEWWFNHHGIAVYSPPMPGSQEAIANLCNDNDLFIVSNQPTLVTRQATLTWLHHNFSGVEWAGIFFSGHKDVINLDVMIDDYHKNLDASTTKYKILFSRPWNYAVSGYHRMESWEALPMLLNLLDCQKGE